MMNFQHQCSSELCFSRNTAREKSFDYCSLQRPVLQKPMYLPQQQFNRFPYEGVRHSIKHTEDLLPEVSLPSAATVRFGKGRNSYYETLAFSEIIHNEVEVGLNPLSAASNSHILPPLEQLQPSSLEQKPVQSIETPVKDERSLHTSYKEKKSKKRKKYLDIENVVLVGVVYDELFSNPAIKKSTWSNVAAAYASFLDKHGKEFIPDTVPKKERTPAALERHFKVLRLRNRENNGKLFRKIYKQWMHISTIWSKER